MNLARYINSIATGNKKRRIIGTPIGFFIFSCFILFFIYFGLKVDKWLGLPQLTVLYTIVIAIVLFLPGFILAVWTIVQFARIKGTPVPVNPPPKLITTGLYSYVRNPMTMGALFMLEGAAFYLGSLALILFFAPLPVVLYLVFIKLVEEPELEMRFGQGYRDYKKKVPMLFPRFKAKR